MPRSFLVTRWAIVWFVLSTAVAMALYPGGTYLNKTTLGYSFFSNFLSDLGTVVAWGGEPNLPAAVIFVLAEVVLVGALIAFFAALLKRLSTGAGKRWAQAGVAAGLLAAIGILIAALVPADRFLTLHVQGALLAFRGLVPAAACFAIATARDRRFSRRAVAGWIVLTVLLAAYIGILQWGPRIRTDYGLTFQATAQKVIVFALLVIVWLESVAGEQVPLHVEPQSGVVPSADRETRNHEVSV